MYKKRNIQKKDEGGDADVKRGCNMCKLTAECVQCTVRQCPALC